MGKKDHTVQKSKRKIVDIDKMDTPKTQIYDAHQPCLIQALL